MNPSATILATSLWALALVQGAYAQAPAATGSVGPYYATPSWDQKLPSATRFIVLSNWGGEATLDRETGLVWQTTLASEADTAANAHQICLDSKVGARGGWRLPTIQELMRTMVARSDGYVVVDSPFAFLASMANFGVFGLWSSTSIDTNAVASGIYPYHYYAYMVNRVIHVQRTRLNEGSINWAVWCVQSPDAGHSPLLW